MKRKRAIFAILCVMVFSLCGFAGAAFAETGTGSSAKTYVAGGGFHASEVESTTESSLLVSVPQNVTAKLVVNKPIGGMQPRNLRLLRGLARQRFDGVPRRVGRACALFGAVCGD